MGVGVGVERRLPPVLASVWAEIPPPRPARDGQGEGSGNDLPGPASPLASRRPATSSLMTQGTQGHGDRV